jgi:hypothetical protein
MSDELSSDPILPADDASTDTQPGGGIWRLFVFLTLIGIAAAICFAVVRRITGSKPTDPTTERIQTLIDEANRLLKELDDKKPA